MANGVTFDIPEEVPEDFVAGAKLFEPSNLESFDSGESTAPDPASGRPIDDPSFEPPDPASGRPLAEIEKEPRGWWEQRATSFQRGMIQLDQALALAGATQRAIAYEGTQEQARMLAEVGKTLATNFEESLERDAAQIEGMSPEEIEAWKQQRRDQFAQTILERAEANKEKAKQHTVDFAALAQELEGYDPSEAMQEFGQAEGVMQTLGVLLTNLPAFLDLQLETLPQSFPAMAASGILGVALGPVGVAAGQLLSGAPEVTGRMLEVMQEEGIDLQDPAQVEAFLADPKKRADALSKGFRKGLAISMFGSFFGALAGKFVTPALTAAKKSVPKIIAGGAAEAAVGSVGEGLGEAAGQLASGQELDAKDIIAEVAASGTTTAVETTAAALHDVRQLRNELTQTAIDEAARATEALKRAALIAEQIAQAEARLKRKASTIGDKAIQSAEQGDLTDPDAIAAAQRKITEETAQAQAAQRDLEGNAKQLGGDTALATETLGAATEVLGSPKVQKLADAEKGLEEAEMYARTIAELEKTDPEAAVHMKYPKASEAFEAQRERLPGNVLIEVENQDGSREAGVFSGYYAPNMISFGSFKPEQNAFSHGILNPQKQKVLSPIPSFEEWTAQQKAEKQADALSQQETTKLPQDERAQDLRPLEKEIRDEGETVKGRQEKVAPAPAPESGRPIAEVDQAAQSQLRPLPEDATITYQAPQGGIPGFVQVDIPDETSARGRRSLDASQLVEAGFEALALPAGLEQGQYSPAEIARIAAEGAAPAETVAPPPEAPLATPVPQRAAVAPVPATEPTEESAPRPTREQSRRRGELGRIARGLRQRIRRAEGEQREQFQQQLVDVEAEIESIPKRTPLAPEQRRPRRRMRLPLPPDGRPDILNAIQDYGGIPAPRKGQRGGEYNGFRDAFRGVARFLVNTTTPGSQYGAGGIDTWLSNFYTSGEGMEFAPPGVISRDEDSPDPGAVQAEIDSQSFQEFFDRVSAAVQRRTDQATEIGTTAARERFANAALGNEKRLKRRTADNPTRAGSLAVGDQFEIDGEQFVVLEVDPATGDVFVQDGILWEFGPNDYFYPDKGTLQPLGRMRQRLRTPEEEASLAAERDEEMRALAQGQQEEIPEPAPEAGQMLDDEEGIEELMRTGDEDQFRRRPVDELDEEMPFEERAPFEDPAPETPGIAAKKRLLKPEIAALLPNSIVEHIAIEELQKLNRVGAERLQRLYKATPAKRELRSIAEFGSAGRTWYQDFRAVMDAAGLSAQDEYYLAGVLAATSPNKSVRSNAQDAMRILGAWNEAGRPKDPAAIRELLAAMPQKVALSDRNNVVAVLANTDTDTAISQMSDQSRKVKPFFRALMGDENAVVLDTHMARLFGVRQKKLAKANMDRALTATVKEVAKRMGWTPAETQAAMWTTARYYGNAVRRALDAGRPIGPVMAEPVTNAALIRDDDLATLLTNDFAQDFEAFGGNAARAARELGRIRQSRPVAGATVVGAGGGSTLSDGYQRSLGRRLRDRYLDSRARTAGEDVADDTVLEQGEQYADRLEIEDEERRSGAIEYVAQVEENAVQGELNLYPTPEQTRAQAEEVAPLEEESEVAEELDADVEFFVRTGQPSQGIRERLAAGETLSAILLQHVRGAMPTFNIDGMRIARALDFVQTQLALRSPFQESMKFAFLDDTGKVIHSGVLSLGSINSTIIDGRMMQSQWEMAKRKAPGLTRPNVILAHNHPSGATEPSQADRSVMRIMTGWATTQGGQIADFLITDGDSYFSMSEGGGASLPVPHKAAWEGIPARERFQLDPGRTANLIAVLRQGNPNAEFAIYLDSQNGITGMDQIPPGSSPSEFARRAMSGAGATGGSGVLLVGADRSVSEMTEVLDTLRPSRLDIVDLSSTEFPSWRDAQDQAERLGTRGPLFGRVMEDQAAFDFDKREAAKPFPIVKPPPLPPTPAISSEVAQAAVRDENDAPPSAVPLSQERPSSPPPQWTSTPSAESREAIDAEGLALLDNLPAEEAERVPERLRRENIKTEVLGRIFTVLGRRGGPEERKRAIGRASSAFQEAGLDVVFDADNEVFRLANQTRNQEEQGRQLIEILERELARGSADGSPLLSVLINSIRQGDGGLWKAPGFSQNTRNRLFALAQGEASFYGLMLGALSKAKRSLHFVAEHIDVVLHKAYSDAFGGEKIGRIIDTVKGVAGGIMAGDLNAKLSDRMRGVLDRLDTKFQQGVDLDYFIGQVLDMIGQGKRRRSQRPELQQLPSLFDLANWRLFITQRGGNDLANQVMSLINGDETAEMDGNVEGNVKRMDRLLQRDLRQIVKEVIPAVARERNEPNFLQDLMTAKGDDQSRVERLQVVDDEVRRRLNETEAKELETENADPDAIAEKYELLREQWDQHFTQISGTLTSDQMVRRIVNQHLRPIFERMNAKWADVLAGRVTVEQLRRQVMSGIESTFNEFNQRAPEAAIDEGRTDQILNLLRNGFDTMAANKLDTMRARREAAQARRRAELPQRTAQQELNRLAELHSDVQGWPQPTENAVRDAIAEQRNNPVSSEQFENTLVALGVQPATAKTLAGIVNRDITARETHARLRREAKVAMPRRERDDQAGQERRTGLKGLVDRIFAATPAQQNDPRWRERTALEYFQENGLSREEAEEAWNLFADDFEGLLKQAATRALEQMRTNLTRRERALVGTKMRGKPLFQRLQESINAGVFDHSEIMQAFAKEFGWSVPSEVQITTLKALAAREQQLGQLSEDERERIGDDPEALEGARIDKAAATLNERLRIQQQMHSLYAQFSRPITFRTAEGRRNLGEAEREIVSASMLLKLGFGVKQVIDVGIQFAVHMPLRTLAQARARRAIAIAAGDPSEFWSDVAEGMEANIDVLRAFAGQAATQWLEAMRGQGVRRNVEGMRSAISGFDRMKATSLRLRNEIQDKIAAGGPRNLAAIPVLQAQRTILMLMGTAEFALRFTRAMDNIQGVFVEQQEIRERLISELHLNAELSPTEARRRANEILADWRREQDMALIRATDFAEQYGLRNDPNSIRAAAYEIYKGRQFARMKAAGLDANAINEAAENQRQTVGWNMREETGIGGAVGSAVRAVSRVAERQGFALPLGQFSNAIAIGINRALTWSGAGFFPSWFGGVEAGVGRNAWFRTEADRQQRKLEATIGLMGGAALTSMAFAGLLRVWIKPPDDPEEREVWQKEGHRAGTVEFGVGGGRFIPISLTSGPMSLFRIPLTGIGAAQDVVDRSVRRRTRLLQEAKAKGVRVVDDPGVKMSDLSAAASLGAFTAIMGGRTAGGALRSLRAGTDRDAMTVKTAIAAQLSPYVVGLPAYQEMQRALETRLDPAEANIIDLMIPTQGSDARRYNFLSDELGPGFTQQLTQTLTGGSFGVVDPDRADRDRAYEIFRKIEYRPSPIERNHAVIINGTIRPFEPEEYRKVQFRRGQIMKEMLQDVDPNQDPRVLTRWAAKIAQESKAQAIREFRGQELNLVNLDDREEKANQAKELFGAINSLPQSQRQAAFDDALAEGRIPMRNGDVDPVFLEEWRMQTQNRETSTR